MNNQYLALSQLVYQDLSGLVNYNNPPLIKDLIDNDKIDGYELEGAMAKYVKPSQLDLRIF